MFWYPCWTRAHHGGVGNCKTGSTAHRSRGSTPVAHRTRPPHIMVERNMGEGVVTELLVDVHCAGCVKPVQEALRTVPGTRPHHRSFIPTCERHCSYQIHTRWRHGRDLHQPPRGARVARRGLLGETDWLVLWRRTSRAWVASLHAEDTAERWLSQGWSRWKWG